MDLKSICSNLVAAADKNSPYILIGVGIGGMGATTVAVAKATWRAKDLVKKEEKKLGRKLTRKEIVKLTWRLFIPAAIIFAAATTCIVGSSRIQFKRNLALGVAYRLADETARTMERKLVEVVGEKKAHVVRSAMDKEKVEKHSEQIKEVIVADKTKVLVMDGLTGQLHDDTDMDTIQRKVNELNARLLNEMYISLNELYFELGWRENDVGDILGFNIDDGLIDPKFTTQITDDGRPCLVLNWHIQPKYDYGRNM